MKLGGNSSYEKNPYYTGRRPEKRKYGAACQSVCERSSRGRPQCGSHFSDGKRGKRLPGLQCLPL